MLMCFQVAEICLVICLKSSIFQEKQCYISTNLLILKEFSTPNDFFILKITFAEKNLQNILSSHQNFGRYTFYLSFSFFKDQFCFGMVKQKNFLHVVDLSFDARFTKYNKFSLYYHKQCPINIIKVKCSQIGKMCLIFYEHVLYRQSLTK